MQSALYYKRFKGQMILNFFCRKPGRLQKSCEQNKKTFGTTLRPNTSQTCRRLVVRHLYCLFIDTKCNKPKSSIFQRLKEGSH